MSESRPASNSASSLLTRCPNCETQFRVTDEQLGVASGKVRCGNCMKIFNAIEHRTTSAGIPGHADASTAPPSADTNSAGSGASGLGAEDDFVFQDDPVEDASERGYAGSSLTFSEDELSDSFRDIEEGSIAGFESDDLEETRHNIDESWAEAMLADDSPAPKSAPQTETVSKPEPQPQPEPAVPPEPEPESDFELEWEALTSSSVTTEAPSAADTDSGLSLQADEPATGAWNLEPAEAEPFNAGDERPTYKTDKPFHDLGREPIAVAGKRGGGCLRTTFWPLVVLGLLGVLGAQVGYYQFDRLSAMPELRPYYELACEHAGCELKPLVDVDRIQSRKLVVRTDPDNRNALVVDAEIINRAPFDQPFPAIALTFSNLNGDVVAQSVFAPDTYLAGEAGDLEAMPKEIPVRIAIRIRDPGRDAVNYNIAFRPYTP